MTLTGYAQQLLRRVMPKRFYCEDALLTTHNHSFVDTAEFSRAYRRGLEATGGFDYHNRWRIHVALWAAAECVRLAGDFVECGVNYGFTSSAIMEHLNWDKVGKRFWLVDSFAGIDDRQLTVEERRSGSAKRSAASKRSGFYNCDAERCRANFREWSNAAVVQGWIPDCLGQIDAARVAFMHIDLNSAVPEVLAFKHFLPRLTTGALVLLDDYAYCGGGALFAEWNRAANELGFRILSLPTGQGLIHIGPAMPARA